MAPKLLAGTEITLVNESRNLDARLVHLILFRPQGPIGLIRAGKILYIANYKGRLSRHWHRYLSLPPVRLQYDHFKNKNNRRQSMENKFRVRRCRRLRVRRYRVQRLRRLRGMAVTFISTSQVLPGHQTYRDTTYLSLADIRQTTTIFGRHPILCLIMTTLRGRHQGSTTTKAKVGQSEIGSYQPNSKTMILVSQA